MAEDVTVAMFRGAVYNSSLLQHECPNLNSLYLVVGSLLSVFLPNVTSGVEGTDQVPDVA